MFIDDIEFAKMLRIGVPHLRTLVIKGKLPKRENTGNQHKWTIETAEKALYKRARH